MAGAGPPGLNGDVVMQLPASRTRITAAAIAICGAGAVIGMTGTGLASAAAPAARRTVMVTCTNRAKVRPSQFVLTCADGNDYLTSLHWVSWDSSAAFAAGTEHENDCTPNCAAGKFYTYPVLITVWRAKPLAGHPGERYFSRLTEIHTGSVRKYSGSRIPKVQTYHLQPSFTA